MQLPGEEQRAFPGGPVAGAGIDEGDRDLPTAAEIAEFPNLADLSAGLAPVVAPVGEKENAEVLFPHPVQEVSGDGEGLNQRSGPASLQAFDPLCRQLSRGGKGKVQACASSAVTNDRDADALGVGALQQ